jgi:hypothetical protein
MLVQATSAAAAAIMVSGAKALREARISAPPWIGADPITADPPATIRCQS